MVSISRSRLDARARSCQKEIEAPASIRYLFTLRYTEDGAEPSGSEYAAGGSSAFEDEAYGDASLRKIVSHLLGVEIPAIPPPTNYRKIWSGSRD